MHHVVIHTRTSINDENTTQLKLCAKQPHLAVQTETLQYPQTPSAARASP